MPQRPAHADSALRLPVYPELLGNCRNDLSGRRPIESEQQPEAFCHVGITGKTPVIFRHLMDNHLECCSLQQSDLETVSLGRWQGGSLAGGTEVRRGTANAASGLTRQSLKRLMQMTRHPRASNAG